MRDLKNKLTSGKNTKNIKSTRGKSFGYQVLGFGAGGAPLPPFIEATGGTVTTSGNCKIHKFTSPGSFVVTNIGTCGPNSVDYLVVAGGGGGGCCGGGGGAGGFRTSFPSPAGVIPLSKQTYPITVGAGAGVNTRGSDSVFSSITSTGGGQGGPFDPNRNGGPGGSGGGGVLKDFPVGSPPTSVGGIGNTPAVSPPQGRNGGNAGARTSPAGPTSGGGGGGAGAVGGNSTNISVGIGGSGGNGLANSITASSVTYAGGGGGSSNQFYNSDPQTAGSGGTGGGGCGTTDPPSSPPAVKTGDANTGGGAGAPAGTGGSGIVVIRYKFQ